MAVKIPQEYLDLNNDFGFSGVSEEEYRGEIITKVDEAASSAEMRAKEQTAMVYKRKLADVERQIMPLLVNLLKTAEKEYGLNRLDPIPVSYTHLRAHET